MYEKIKELDELRKQGLLSDEEFAEEKKKILNGDKKNGGSSSFTNDSNVTMNNKKLAYIIFAIFLGNFGVHKFASKQVGAGLLYLVFFWTGIPGVIGFIEGILAIFKENGEWDEMSL